MRRFFDFWLTKHRWYRRMIGGKWYLNAYRWDIHVIEVWEQVQFKEDSWPRTVALEDFSSFD